MPRSGDIDEAVAGLAERGSSLSWALPGPLEGHRRPAKVPARRLTEDDVNTTMEEFAKDPASPKWSNLAYLSQYFDLGENCMECLREASARFTLDEGEGTVREERLKLLTDACLVAVAQRDVELARVIAATVVAGAHEARSGDEAAAIFRVLLLASATFENENEWAEWLEEQLAQVAARLPAGEASKVFLEHLEEVKKVVKLTLCIHGRAEALASAAT